MDIGKAYYIGDTTEEVRIASLDRRLKEIELHVNELSEMLEEIMDGMIYHNLI